MPAQAIKIVYMGTPEFAVAPLEALLDEGFSVRAVITAPDKPAGRGKKLQASAVKVFAVSRGIEVLQPEKLKDPEFIETLRRMEPDLQVVVAFRMLPEIVWSLPPLGTFNLHASLLPQYRGAAPINHAIINGEKITGVTTFFINDKIDAGKILLREAVDIPEGCTAGDLHDKLMVTGASLVVKTVKAIISGDWKEITQESLVGDSGTLREAPKIFKEDCQVNWNQNGIAIQNFIRGLSPSPAAFTTLKGIDRTEISLKIYNAVFVGGMHNLEPGSIIIPGKKTLYVAVKDGYISLLSMSQAGKNMMDAASFLNGFKNPEKYKAV